MIKIFRISAIINLLILIFICLSLVLQGPFFDNFIYDFVLSLDTTDNSLIIKQENTYIICNYILYTLLIILSVFIISLLFCVFVKKIIQISLNSIYINEKKTASPKLKNAKKIFKLSKNVCTTIFIISSVVFFISSSMHLTFYYSINSFYVETLISNDNGVLNLYVPPFYESDFLNTLCVDVPIICGMVLLFSFAMIILINILSKKDFDKFQIE